jgi:molybdopterin/thiamine biosynthesis adenylyltransferase
MIIVQGDELNLAGSCPAKFAVREDEGLYSSLSNVNRYLNYVPGTVLVCDDIKRVKVSEIGSNSDRVRVLIGKGALNLKKKGKCSLEARGYILKNGQWVKDEVMIVPVKEQLSSRWGGLLESDVLMAKRVFAPGLGSGGAPSVISLVQSGVGYFDLMDDDLLMVSNLMRHPLTLSDVGRYKTKAMADFIRDKNPYAQVRTWERKVNRDNIDLVRDLVRQADIVICGTDNRESKLLLNRICVEEDTGLILGNAFRRAYGGKALRVRPHKSLCYQCYLRTVPGQSRDQEIANSRQAEGLAYTDRPVPIEPGLALDIAPLWQMVGKLALMELLRGTETTFASLYEDFVAPLYIWINRREKGTDYAKLTPLEFEIDGMHICRWYGAAIPRDPECDVCGDFVGAMAKKHGLTPEDLQTSNDGTGE